LPQNRASRCRPTSVRTSRICFHCDSASKSNVSMTAQRTPASHVTVSLIGHTRDGRPGRRAALMEALLRSRIRERSTVHLLSHTARENVKSSVNTAAQGLQSLTERFTNFTGLAEAEELARRSFENLQAVSDSSSVLARGIQEASQLWIALAQERLAKNVEGFSRFARCRSPQDFTPCKASSPVTPCSRLSRRAGAACFLVH
jgi:hypothetical protein